MVAAAGVPLMKSDDDLLEVGQGSIDVLGFVFYLSVRVGLVDPL